jgi:hypothetical protein
MGRAIGERFETDPVTFSMIAGAFRLSNCRFEFLFTGIARSIVNKSHETIKASRSEIRHPILKLVLLLFDGEPLALFRLCVFSLLIL